MPVANNMLMFEDVRRAMDMALEQSVGIKIQCGTSGQATNFRQRCYKFRKHVKTVSMQTTAQDDPEYGFCAYDALALSLAGPYVVMRHREYTQPQITILEEGDSDFD